MGIESICTDGSILAIRKPETSTHLPLPLRVEADPAVEAVVLVPAPALVPVAAEPDAVRRILTKIQTNKQNRYGASVAVSFIGSHLHTDVVR